MIKKRFIWVLPKCYGDMQPLSSGVVNEDIRLFRDLQARYKGLSLMLSQRLTTVVEEGITYQVERIDDGHYSHQDFRRDGSTWIEVSGPTPRGTNPAPRALPLVRLQFFW